MLIGEVPVVSADEPVLGRLIARAASIITSTQLENYTDL